MPQYQISVPGQGTFVVDSPSELTDLQAWQAVQSQLSAAPAQPQKSTITGELVRGGKQLASSIRTGLESIVSPEQAAVAGVERGQKIGEEAGEGPSFAAVRKAYEEKGILPAAGEVISQIPRALAGQGAQLAAMAGGARLGAMAGSAVLPGPGTLIGGVLGAGATLLPQFMGANVERQAQEQLERGEPVSIDRTKAYGAAAGQAALEATGTAFVLGKRLVKGVLGIADDAALATAKAQQELAKAAARSVSASAGRGALRGTAEIPVEIAQAVLERAQAGLDLTSPEALSEYGENAYLAGLIGPTIGGVSGVAERSGARAKLRETAPAPEVPPAPPAPPVGALEFKPEPFIQFPDGTVAKRSEVEAYIKTLPEDQQMAMRAKLLGLAPQEAEKEPAPPAKALEYKPEPLIVYPDGSVAKRSEVDAYIQGLPEDEQIPARAKLLGMGEEATQVTPEMLRKLGIRGRAPIIQRLTGLELTDPKVAEELTNFAQQPFASPEVRGNIFGFLNTIKPIEAPAAPETPAAPPVAPAPVSEAPPAVEPPAPPVTPTVETPAPAAETPAPVETAAPSIAPVRQVPIQTVDLKTGEKVSIETQNSPTAFSNLVRSQFGEPQALVAKNKDGEEIGRLTYMPNGGPIDVSVREKDRRKGVATALYDAFEAQGGKLPDIESGVAISDEARAVRAAREKRQQTEPVAPKAEAPAVEAPAAPPTLDTTGIKEVKGRHPQVQAAAKLLQDKKMTREEFEKYVDYYKPIQEVEAEKLLPPTSEQRMNETVNADKRDKINVPVADGTKVGLRMDLPARERGGSVVSIHEGKPGKLTVGKLMGFRSTGWLKDVTFEVRSQEKGLAVAAGAAKAPQQTVEGTWQNLSPEETYARVKELMKDPAWKQIGFDPSRHGYFYDRKTREPVVSSSEMYQVGQFLLAKDVKYAPKTEFLYSLGKEQTKQLQDFQQTLRNLLNKFGLKDVGLNIVEGMDDAGSYSQQLIRIAAEEANPIRTLRHEAIHALRELGFFTDAQWKSLSKMAKDKWIDQYLKQRNVQGRPLKAGEESRYDAYMREYNGDMEKITEEAVADAFADFDATKPPAGMLQALLKRMKDLFQSIKSALTKVESPEQIFGKVEKGELTPGEKRESDERKSVRDRATANFLRWFGDSKVVDEKGEPLVVYHGTLSGGFSVFAKGNSGTYGDGIYFSSDPSVASFWAGDREADLPGESEPGGSVYPVYVSIKNPASQELAEDVESRFGSDTSAELQRMGYDGIIAGSEYVAFRPEQIKSAIGNNGDYSLTNPDIRKSLSGKRSTQEVARIFGQMVKRAEKELSSALFNWNDSRLNEDKDKIVVYPGRDQRFVRGKEGGKSNVSKAEFIDWLMSDAPFDTSVYGEEITRDAEWKSEIETLRSIVTTPDIRKSLGKATAAAQKALQKQPMPEKGLSHVSKDLTNLAQPIFFPQNKTVLDRIDSMKDRFWQRLAQKTADQFRTIKEYSPLGYMQARLSKSVDGSLEGLLFHGQVFDDGGALNIKKNTKGMMDILKPIGNELDSYLMWVALNRESRLETDRRSKIPNMDKLVARRAEFAAGELNGKPRVEVYQDVLKQMNQLNKSVLDIALAKGLIDQAGYDKFSNDIYYIPFYKKMEEDGTIEGAQTASGLTSQYFSKELKGGEAPFGDLMENIVRNWSHILSASMKNAAAQTTLKDAMELQAAEPNLKAGLEWKDGKVYSTKSGKPIEAKFDEDGTQLYAEGELRPDLTTGAAGMAKVMVNGQPMYFKVTDDLLMDSISSIGYLGPKSKFLDVARGFKNMLQYGVTASPIFKVNNLIRDSVSALAVSDLKKSPVSNVMKGISLSKPDSPTYISALAGGAIFNFGSAYEGDQAKLIKRLIDQGVEGDTILDSKEKITKALKKTWDAYQHLGDRSEAANRLALYQQLRDKGMSHLEASFMARDLLDFSMQGSWPAFRLITQVVPFMNARIQGLYKLGRDGINPTVRVLYNATTGKEIDANDKIRAAQFATVSAAVMLASALLYLTFKDDEDFKKRDAWDRDNFWWFKIPSLDIAFRVPKPFEVGAFGTLVERSLEQILDQGAEGKTFGESLKRTLWDTFALNPTPQMFKPLLDIYANKDSFSGAPIESAGLERLSKQERVTEQTSPLAIAMSAIWSMFMPEKLESSPVQMDYAIKGYFGWLGAMASLSSTYAVMPFKEGEYPDARWLDRASLGLVRDLPAPQSAYVTAFYNSSKEISQAYADMRHYREMGDAEKVQELLEEKGDKIALAKFYDKTAKNIANVRKQIQLITNDKNLDGAEKKEMIERMKLIMSDLAKQAEEVRKSMKQ